MTTLQTYYPGIAIFLLLTMAIAMEIGQRLAQSEIKRHPNVAPKGISSIESAVFALFGLLLAFTFSGAASRFEHRRDLIVQETNAIGTAYLRLDLLKSSDQTTLRPLFRQYVQSRIDTYQAIDQGVDHALAHYAQSQELQAQIWAKATTATANTGNPAIITLVLSAINEMIDITTTRLAAARAHPPLIIYGLLIAFAIASATLIGYSASISKEPHWLHKIFFAVCIAGTIYTTLDLEYPRAGFIRAEGMDQHFDELLHSIQPKAPISP